MKAVTFSLTRHERPLLILILTLYLLITLAYGIVNPLFEAPDEHWHFFTAVYIAETGQLPQVTANYDTWLSQEAAQPPLYYVMGALLITPMDASAARDTVWLNPFASIGDADALTNRNRAIHGLWEAWPWQGYALAAHALRLFSTLLGLGTLLFVYGSSRLLWPDDGRKALLGTAVIAFLPQFNFLHAAISNDTLITCLSAAAIWQILRLLRGPYSVYRLPITDYRLPLLGLTIGLAALSKNAGILLLVYAAGVVGWLWLRNVFEMNNWRGEVKRAANLQPLIANLLLLIIPVLLSAGWLWWRNWTLYGDMTAANQFIRIADGNRGYSLWQVLGESGGLWKSFFAIFGWFNVRPPAWVFGVWNGIVLTAIIGAVKNVNWRSLPRPSSFLRSPPTALLLFAWLLLVYAGLVTFMMQTEAAQGRLLFPALIPLTAALVYGLIRWSWRGVYWLPPLLALGTTLYCLIAVIRPVYAPPPLLDALPPTAQRLDVEMGQGLTLVGAHVETETAVPGDPITLTLYWQAVTTPTIPSEFKLEIFGRDLALGGELHSYHGRGLYPATLWPSQQIVADRFSLYLDETVKAPVLAQLYVRLVAAGAPSVYVGAVKVTPTAWPQTAATVQAQLGSAIQLVDAQVSASSARPGDTVFVDVTWQVTGAPGSDFTTLIHLAMAGQPPLAQADGPPLGGDYPTGVWAAGEVIVDRYELTLPEEGVADGRYPIWIGMYDHTLTRLPLTSNGARLAHDVYQIGWLTLTNLP
ncbi:MAG: DUF2142 domain-containing protein [Anaerolinea sp.]|nr:DUF2142 domain-containing protein [Anaerolinea sp.]